MHVAVVKGRVSLSKEKKVLMKPTDEQYKEWAKQRSRKIEVTDVAGPIRVGPPRMEDTPRFPPTVWPVAEADFWKNLENYRKFALDIGATDAKVVSTKDIPQDRRAYYILCLFPSCRWLNTNANCPKHETFPFETAKRFIADYRYAIVFKVFPPKMDGVPDVGKIDLDMYYTMGGQEAPDKAMLARNIVRLRILGEMTRRIRAEAYYGGYILTAPIGYGPCLVEKCADERKCQALKPAGMCKFVDVQPCGSGTLYIDYHNLARNLGWGELQPSGNCVFPEDVPDFPGYYNIGVVLID